MTDTITIPRALLEQALEATGCERIKDFYAVGPVQRAAVESFAEALRSALEQPQHVVRHRHEWFSTGAMKSGEMRCIHCGEWAREEMQPQQEPLTEDQILALDPAPHVMFDKQRIDFARAIEAAHNIGGANASKP